MTDLLSPPLQGWVELLPTLGLDAASSTIAVERVAAHCIRMQRKVTHLGRVYWLMKVVVTSGALLVPAVSGLDMSQGSSEAIFWIIWSISLATALSNGLLSLFSVDRKYFETKERLQRLETEAWLFVSRAGKYKEKSLQDLFPTFLENCEHLIQSFTDHSNRHFSPGEVTEAAPPSSDVRTEPSER